MLLQGKTTVIFGGAGPIGSTAARIFAREGARLFLAGRTLPNLERLARDIIAHGRNAEANVVDGCPR